jgi:hypothetical protein
MPPVSHAPRSILLRGEHDAARCQRLRAELTCTKGAATCNIFYLPTSDVEVPGLPAAWSLDGVDYDTLTLACGHVFNPSALALHFLVSDMRCPACRIGPTVRLDATSLPGFALRERFQDKAAGMCVHAEATAEISVAELLDATDLDINRLEQDLTFTIEISLVGGGALRSNMLQTRIAPVHEHRSGEFVHYVTQQSFQRLFSRQVARHRENASARVRFHVQHPLLAQSMSSPGYPLAELLACMATREFVVPFVFGDEPAEHDPVLATLVFTPPKQEVGMGNTANTDNRDTANTDITEITANIANADNRDNTANTANTDNTDNTGNTAHMAAIQVNISTPTSNQHQDPARAHATLLVHRQGVLALCVAAAQHALLNSIMLVQTREQNNY